MAEAKTPSATYRLQFNAGFTFRDAQALVPYLHALGVSHIYASPIFQARPGSTHGYDITDPTKLNSELGSEDDFEAFVDELRSHDMGLVLDIVPNHMAATLENPWWRDVLEHGPTSASAEFFDIQWRKREGDCAEPVVLPVLGQPLDQALAIGELALTLNGEGFGLCYGGQRFPLEARSWGTILRLVIASAGDERDSEHVEKLRRLSGRLRRLAPWQSVSKRGAAARRQAAESLKREAADQLSRSPGVADAAGKALAALNDSETVLSSLQLVLAEQPYQLEFWRTGRRKLNYRRFFDINDLVGMRVESPKVFDATHSLIMELVRKGQADGLRVDHIDGLYDPGAYLRRLRRRIGPDAYLVVEKILAPGEDLPANWPVEGTSGYEFLNLLNGLFVDRQGLDQLMELHQVYCGSNGNFRESVYLKKKQAIEELFPAEFEPLRDRLVQLASGLPRFSGVSGDHIGLALFELTSRLPVYRSYLGRGAASAADVAVVEQALEESSAAAPAQALDLLRRLLLGGGESSRAGPDEEERLDLVASWQQFTGPVMAKGAEDTALYCYGPLLSLNEVGGEPDEGATSADSLHQFFLRRKALWPASMNAGTTHDTKRSEDVRARLNVLSEMPGLLRERLDRWTEINRTKKSSHNGEPVPDPFTEWFLYQTILGAWPSSDDAMPGFADRIKEYAVKAVREAKTHTSWTDPDEDYETVLTRFVDSILDETRDNRFLPEFRPLQQRVASFGFVNSLSQTVLKMTAPGVPDTYQGTELWDLSLVDPDNRRKVDFPGRRSALQVLDQRIGGDQLDLCRDLLDRWSDGVVKLYVSTICLRLRRDQPDLFTGGEYLPLPTQGPRRDRVFAFARRRGAQWAVMAVPLGVVSLAGAGGLPTGEGTWRDSALVLPEDAPQGWTNLYTGERYQSSGSPAALPLAQVFAHFPVAVLAPSDLKP